MHSARAFLHLPRAAARGGLRRPGCALLLACAFALAPLAAAQSQDPLVSLINVYRSAPQGCAGAGRPVGPLAPAPQLANVRAASGERLQDALRDAGYLAARSVLITLSGPASPMAAMRLLRERHCRALLDARHAEIGVARDGRNWRIVLAQPLLSDDLGGWREAGREVLELVNAARAEARVCGKRRFKPAPPLAWDPRLADAARVHSLGMARTSEFNHAGADGSRAGDRALRQGYRWRRIGENIAAGQGSAQQAVSAWLQSPGHCANIMEPRFAEMGAAYVVEPESDARIYWTQVLATPRR